MNACYPSLKRSMTSRTNWYDDSATAPCPVEERERARKPLARILLSCGLLLLAAAAIYLITHSQPLSLALVAISIVVLGWNLGAKYTTGIFLLLIPLQWLVITLLQFNGVSQYRQISAIKELVLLGAVLWFFSRTHFKILLPDLILGAAMLLVIAEQIFHPDLQGMRDDWEWVLAYLLGRVLILHPHTQTLWAKAAVWMCALLAIAGAWEVEVLGSAPRLLLQQATGGDAKLATAFTATGYTGFRAASTMVSPLAFSALCMVALLLWWTYMKNPLPALLISAGLALSLTRSSIVATVLGIVMIAIRRKERARLAFFAGLFLAGLAVAVVSLDLEQYVRSSFTFGADASAVGHQNSIVQGFNTMLDHPLGIGAGTVGPHALTSDSNALQIENSYLVIAVEYGVVAGLLYAAFTVSCLLMLFRQRDSITYAAFSILAGYAFLLSIGPIHLDIPLSCWIWVPVGMAITRTTFNPRPVSPGDPEEVVPISISDHLR